MNDMDMAIIPKSDQINSDDFIPGPQTFTVTGVTVRGGEEQPVSISLANMSKVYRPCKSMSRVLVAAWGADSKAYVGQSFTLYRDPGVKWGGMAVGGIRISHMSHIDREMTMMLTMTKQNRAPHKVKVLEAQRPEASPSISDAKVQAEALAAANKGTGSFKEWWAASKDKRPDCAPIMDQLKAACAAADAAKDADPFGLPPISTDPKPTPEEMAAAEQSALAAMQVTE